MKVIFTDPSKAVLLWGAFCYLCFAFVLFSCLIIAALCSPAKKWLTSWLSLDNFRSEAALSPPVKYLTDCSKAVYLLWIFYVFSVFDLLCLCVRLFICALWSPAGKGLSFVVSNCEFVTFPFVSWVRCGT